MFSAGLTEVRLEWCQGKGERECGGVEVGMVFKVEERWMSKGWRGDEKDN